MAALCFSEKVMNKIGSWWLASIKAAKNEEIELSYPANRTQTSNRAVGGKLYICLLYTSDAADE